MKRLIPLFLLLAACADPSIRYPLAEPETGCERGDPRPLLSKANPDILAVSSARLGQGRLRETAFMRGRVKLTAFSVRCSVVRSIFVFELPMKPRRLDHRASWYRRAALLLEGASESSPEARGLREIASRLRDSAERAPEFGTQIEMGEFQSLSLSVGEDQKGIHTLVEIRYALKI